ncbi:MAG: hypothetical protein M1371_01050 [Actinobacteria bacterium]|nr:hypothetical protein [Actinomycetota bacterium]
MFKKVVKSFFKNFLFFVLGFGIGFIIYYFIPTQSVDTILGYKYVQSIFGIKPAAEFASNWSMFGVVLLTNFVSVVCLFFLGWLMVGPAASTLLGIILSLLLFTGPLRHGMAIAIPILALIVIESLYRLLAITTGTSLIKRKEYMGRHFVQESVIKVKRDKHPLGYVLLVILILGLLVYGAYYEVFLF